MTLTKAQLSRSIVDVFRAAASFGTGRAARTRPITGEEAELWALRKQEQRAKLKEEADATSWPISE
jgi:hypothetical protein